MQEEESACIILLITSMPNLSTFMSQTHEYNEVYPQSLKVLDKNSLKQLSKLTAGKTIHSIAVLTW